MVPCGDDGDDPGGIWISGPHILFDGVTLPLISPKAKPS